MASTYFTYCDQDKCQLKTLHHHCEFCPKIINPPIVGRGNIIIYDYHIHCQRCPETNYHIHCLRKDCLAIGFHHHCEKCSRIDNHRHCHKCNRSFGYYDKECSCYRSQEKQHYPSPKWGYRMAR